MIEAAERLMAAVRGAQVAPYIDHLQRTTGLSDAGMTQAMRELSRAGLAQRFIGPQGVLIYPTLRGYA